MGIAAIMKVALIHDYLIEFGGAERVLGALHRIWPEAPIYTSFFRPEKFSNWEKFIKDWQIVPGGINKVPLAWKLISPLRFFAPLFFESKDLTDFDLVVSSSNTYSAKSVITGPETLHLSYIHTPPRALYGYDPEARWRRSSWKKMLAALPTVGLRVHDFISAQRVDHLIANSEETRQRILKFYRRNASVIYPPVEVDLIWQKTRPYFLSPGEYFLAVGRFWPPKRLDLAIGACNKLKKRLLVVGSGVEEKKLKSLAGESIEFTGEINDDKLYELYSKCRAVIFTAQDEDFGLVPVEAMAAGKPVIALNQGGVRETVIPDKTGKLFTEATEAALIESLENFDPDQFSPEDCYHQALKFDYLKFRQKILKLVDELI